MEKNNNNDKNTNKINNNIYDSSTNDDYCESEKTEESKGRELIVSSSNIDNEKSKSIKKENYTDDSNEEYESANIYDDDSEDDEEELNDGISSKKTVYSANVDLKKKIFPQLIKKGFFLVLFFILVYFGSYWFNMIGEKNEDQIFLNTNFTTSYVEQNPIPKGIISYIDLKKFENALEYTNLDSVNRTLANLNDKSNRNNLNFLKSRCFMFWWRLCIYCGSRKRNSKY